MSQQGAPAIIQDTFHRKNYKTNHVLGKGGFAIVYHVTDMYSQENYACKLTQKARLTKKKFFEKFTSEIKIHRQLIHPFIVRVNNVFKDSINYYMLMELCNAGTLSDLVRRRQRGLMEEEVQRICFELCQAYSYLKERKIVHRDMKSSNVFLNCQPATDIDAVGDKQPQALVCKIGDFGLSVQLEQQNEKHFTLCGTPNFLPPETIVSHVFRRIRINRECDSNIDAECQELCKQLVQRLNQQAVGRQNYDSIDAGHSYPSDMWSLGCIIYSLLFMRPPFESSNIQNTYKKIVKCDYTINTNKANISKSCVDFIDKLLLVDPNDRLTVEQALQHEWLANGLNVKLKYLPAASKEVDFNVEKMQKEYKSFFNYTCSIDERVQEWKTKPQSLEVQKPVQVLPVAQESKDREQIEDRVQPQPPIQQQVVIQQTPRGQIRDQISIENFIIKKFSTFPFLQHVLKPPNPIRFPPVMQFLDLKEEPIDRASITQFQHGLDAESVGVVFNDYDLWMKFIMDEASRTQARPELIQLHQYVFTLSWIDFSNRYGFAYQLSNGCVGVLFNDMSVVVMSPNLKYVDYIDVINFGQLGRNYEQIQKGEQNPVYADKQQVIIRMRYQNAKDFLSEKKYKLIMYFKEYLENRSIQPIQIEKRDTSDLFINKYFDMLYEEGCRIYAKGISDEQIQQSFQQRQECLGAFQKSGKFSAPSGQVSFAVKMLNCQVAEPLVYSLVKAYVQNIHSQFGTDNPFTVASISDQLSQRMVHLLQLPQNYIKRYNLNEISGTLCILYNSKVFQVNFPDHIKIVIAHKTVTILNNKRETLVYPSQYLKFNEFRFDDLRSRIAEARRLYELVRRSRE